MKRILLVAVVIFAAFAISSCKKCVTCSYEYEYLGEMQYVAFPQECGAKKDLDVYKDDAEAEANRHGVTSTCTED